MAHELTLPLCTGDDVSEPAMDQFPDDIDIERDIIGTVTEDELRNRLWSAFKKITTRATTVIVCPISRWQELRRHRL